MLELDNIIIDILTTEKNNNADSLLKYFHIQHPSKKVAEESNSIFIATVSTENNIDGFDFSSFRDLCEILIVTKQKDYDKAITIIKTISREICRLIMANIDKFPNKPTIRNINPEFNMDFILTRGHIMVECNTDPENFDVTDDEYCICNLLLQGIEEK